MYTIILGDYVFKIYFKSILVPLILGTIIGFITSTGMNYKTLTKPFGAPPGIIFPIVWTILYILMGISYGKLQANNLNSPDLKKVYYKQLIINLIWPIIFFTLKFRFIALLWIIILLISVLEMIITFYKKDHLAGLLQIPYFIWVLYATYLNLGFYLLN